MTQIIQQFDQNIIWPYLLAVIGISGILLNYFKEPRLLGRLLSHLSVKGRSIIKVMAIAAVLGYAWTRMASGDVMYIGKLINTYGWAVACYHIFFKRVMDFLRG